MTRSRARPAMPPFPDPLRVAIVVALAGIAIFALYFAQTRNLVEPAGHLFGRDFVNLHAAGTFIGEGKTAVLFDGEAYLAELRRLVGDPDYPVHNWSYPPLLFPLAQFFATMPYPVAMTIWHALGIVSLLAATRLAGLSTGWAFAVTFSPAAILSMLAGQNGQIVAALIAAATVWGARRRFVRAGLAWAILAAKPHLGLCVLPMLLLQRRVAVLAAGAVFLALAIALTLLCYGPEPWEKFFTYTTAQQRQVIEDWKGMVLYIMPSLFMQGRLLDLGIPAAYGLHLAGALAAVVLLVLARPRRGDDVRGWLTWLAAGTFVLLPYSFVYDLVVFQLALALWHREPGRLFALAEGPAARWLWLAGWLLPLWSIASAVYLGVQPAPFVLLFLIWRRAVAARKTVAATAD